MAERYSDPDLSPKRRAWIVALLRLVWVFFLVHSLYSFLWSFENFIEQRRFNRIYEDSYSYFSAWVNYFTYLQLVMLVVAALALFYFIVAVFIFIRKPNDLIGFLTSISLLGVPETWVWWESMVGWINQLKGVLWVFSFSYLLFVFPNGAFIPPSLKRSVHLALLIMCLTGFGALGAGSALLIGIAIVVLGLLNILGLLSQIYRYLRVSTIPEKQQTKWVVFSILLLVFWVIFYPINPGNALRFEMRALYGLFAVLTGFVVILMIPVAFTISILRYRLFDIDLIIRRTLQYALLTGLLAGLYFVAVIVLQAGATALTGESNSPFVTVLSTLLIAAAFNPLRLRIQEWINRRFYRSTFNAQQVLQQFAVTARDEVELDRLAESILSVAQATMQPERASLWLKQSRQKLPGERPSSGR